ncbi:MAG: UvrD-helicase domain-containing protein [Dermatophilaceae bacterium]
MVRWSGRCSGARSHASNIIAFTFTEKAAAELKDRVLHLVESGGGSLVGLAEMYIGTMHGYCLDLLQRYVPETFKFRVLTDVTSRMLIDRNSRTSGLTMCPTTTPGTPHLRRYVNSPLYQQVLGILREDVVDAAAVPDAVWERSRSRSRRSEPLSQRVGVTVSSLRT